MRLIMLIRITSLITALFLMIAPAHASFISTIPIKPTTESKVWEVPNHSESNIYSSVEQWAVDIASSGNARVSYKDKDIKTLILKGTFDLPRDRGLFSAQSFTNVVHYMLKVEAKNNKYRTTLTMVKQTLVNDESECEETYKSGNDCGDTANFTDDEKIKQTNKLLNELVTKLNTYITNNSTTADNW